MRPPLSFERQVPLFVKFETRPIWSSVKGRFEVDATGAAMITALVEAHGIGQAVSYSRSKMFYCNRTCHPLLTFRRTVGAADALDAGGWIHHARQVPGGRGWQSAMAATEQLVEAFTEIVQGHPRLKLLTPRQAIILRDDGGRPIDCKQTREVDRMERQVAALNEAVTGSEVLTMEGQNVTATMTRIFNGSLARGGRCYAGGASWQNMPAADRKRVTIDGEVVVELDFTALHPAMLYAEAGAPMPSDPYAIDGWPRDLVKLGMLTAINARNIHAARLSIAHSNRMTEVAEPGSQAALTLASRLLEAIREAHRAIAGAFFSDAGARLMRKDSDLAVQIMLDLQRQGIIALPIHDSFLVAASQKDALEVAMLRSAHAIGLREIRIKQA